MARILYGLCNVGMGHAIRSKVIVSELIKKHDVKIVASGFTYSYLKKHFGSRVINIEGFELAFKKNKIADFRTVIMNLKKVSPKVYERFLEVNEGLNKFQPTTVIADWETFSSFYAFNNSVPLIALGNAHYLAYGKYKVGIRDLLDYIKFRFFLKTLMFPAKHYVINCLPGMVVKKNKKVIKAPFVLRDAILKSKVRAGDHILVYQSTKSYPDLELILKSVNEKFIVYGFDINKKSWNLQFKKFDDSKGFIKDLSECKAVICNGGFNLISESLYLEKPVLVVPIKKHLEQRINAQFVEKGKFGMVVKEINSKNIQEFLLKDYKKLKKKQKNNEGVISVLERLII